MQPFLVLAAYIKRYGLRTTSLNFFGYLRNKGLWNLINLSWHIGIGFLDYKFNPRSIQAHKLPKPDYDRIQKEMERVGIRVVQYYVDAEDFHWWVDQANFPKWYLQQNPIPEKLLEHYLSAKFLELSVCKRMIDVAAANSPWKDITPKLYGVSAFSLDLQMSVMIDATNQIVADATFMPVGSNMVDGVALHCAFEAFEGDADIRLIPEVDRVLKPGGKMVVLPLYMHQIYYVDSSPLADRRGLDYQGALRVWREDRGRVRFSRKYNVAAFYQRIVKTKGSLMLTIYRIINLKEIDPSCYCNFVAVFEKST
jgi:SAM-dependent methyltransferase